MGTKPTKTMKTTAANAGPIPTATAERGAVPATASTPAKPKRVRQTTIARPAVAVKPTASKVAAAKARAPRKSTRKPIVKAGFTHEDIALRAYFVSEKRRAAGMPGDEHSDWIEAENQLRTGRAPVE